MAVRLRSRALAAASLLGASLLSAWVPARAADAPWLDLPMSDADRRHLLARAGLGVAPEDYAALAGLTRREAVETTLDGLATEPTLPMPAFTRRPLPHYHARAELDEDARRAFDRARDRELGALRRWWSAEMLLTDSPQTERLVWVLHDLFATSVLGTHRSTLAMARQNATFRAMHSARWADLLRAMLRDAALLEFLDAGANRADAPNENLARELLERFALGEGSGAYDESTVREAARALTGLGTEDLAGLAFRLRTWDHDAGDKTLFGVTGPHGADELVDLLLAEPAAARHLARVWWHAFVSDAPPTDAELEALAAPFRDSGHELRALHRATLESEAFWREDNRAALVKSPVDVLVGLARTLEYPKARVDALAPLLASLGQSPFAPPDVGGWDEGMAWVAPGRLLARHAAATALALGRGGADVSVGATADGSVPGDAIAGEAMAGGAMAGDAMAGDAMAGNATAEDAAPEDGAMSRPDGVAGEPDVFALRLASDELDGPVRIGATLLAGGRTLWDSGEHAVPGGHDRARFGPLDASAGRAWRTHRLAAPPEAIAAADEVRVRFVNDAADARGDRNLYVESARLGARRARAAEAGRQASACPPESPADAGDLYCAGTLSIAFRAAEPVPARPADRLSASAARLRWASLAEDGGRAAATFVLEHARLPGAAGEGARELELLQFRLVSPAPGRLDLRFDAFDCRGDCPTTWPECAWTDERFPRARGVSLSLEPGRKGGRRCVERELEAETAALVLALEAAAPSLLEAVSGSVGATRHAEALDVVRERASAAFGAAPRGGTSGDALAIDPRWAPPPPPSEEPAPVRPRVASLDGLVDALEPLGTDPLALLLPGVEAATVAPGAAPRARLRATLEHPLFQLR